jgi:hypothetical protein
MPKRRQKRKGRSEEKKRAEGTSSSYVLLETDLRRRDLPSRAGCLNGSLQVLLHRSRLTGLIIPVNLYL